MSKKSFQSLDFSTRKTRDCINVKTKQGSLEVDSALSNDSNGRLDDVLRLQLTKESVPARWSTKQFPRRQFILFATGAGTLAYVQRSLFVTADTASVAQVTVPASLASNSPERHVPLCRYFEIARRGVPEFVEATDGWIATGKYLWDVLPGTANVRLKGYLKEEFERLVINRMGLQQGLEASVTAFAKAINSFGWLDMGLVCRSARQARTGDLCAFK